MSRSTAVAAPAQPPFEDLLAVIDQMDGPALRAFIAALRERYNLAEPSRVTVAVEPRVVIADPLDNRTWVIDNIDHNWRLT